MRALAQSLAREFGPKGIHVSHAIIDGVIDIERTKDYKFDHPDAKIKPEAVSSQRAHLQYPVLGDMVLTVITYRRLPTRIGISIPSRGLASRMSSTFGRMSRSGSRAQANIGLHIPFTERNDISR